MPIDDRPDAAKRLEKARIQRGFATARAAAEYFGWIYDSYIQHERGERGLTRAADKYAKALRVPAGWLLTGQGGGTTTTVPIMGFVGAGAEIEPDFEQTPADGFGEIQLSIAVPDDIIALGIRGDSMLPRYRDGDAVLVYREQRRETSSFLGEEAAVRTHDGKRYIKNILRGPEPGTYTLDSWNARPLEGVRLDWVGEIYLMVPRTQLRRIERTERATATRRAKARERLTEGMNELPLMDKRST